MTEAEALARIAEFPGAVIGPGATPVTVTVPVDRWAAFAAFAKDTLRCHFFSFLSAVDLKEEGLEVIAWIEENFPAQPAPMVKFLEGIRKAGLQ